MSAYPILYSLADRRKEWANDNRSVLIAALALLLCYGRFNRRSRTIRRLRRDPNYNTPEFLYNRDFEQGREER